jgi:hypothetical protein
MAASLFAPELYRSMEATGTAQRRIVVAYGFIESYGA